MEFTHGENGLESDLADAELILDDILKQSAKSKAVSVPEKKSVKAKEEKAATEKAKDDRRLELKAVLTLFAEMAGIGESKSLGHELTSFDRLVVHEEAEKLGIDHRSEGEGVGRHIILTMPASTAADSESVSVPLESDSNTVMVTDDTVENSEPMLFEAGKPDESVESEEDGSIGPSGRCASLALHQEEEGENKVSLVVEESQNNTDTDAPLSNNMLGILANERVERQRRMAQKQQQQHTLSTGTKKTKNKKNHKLGGAKRSAQPNDDNALDDLDDMAFLDSQINKVQNSHGRRIESTGKTYRTVVNGILLSKPKPEEKKRDANKSSALQQKLQQAQADRKAKLKKK